MPQLTCNIAELRLSQTQKCTKQRDDKLVIKSNIEANTDDLEPLLIQNSEFGRFSRRYLQLQQELICFVFNRMHDWGAINVTLF